MGLKLRILNISSYDLAKAAPSIPPPEPIHSGDHPYYSNLARVIEHKMPAKMGVEPMYHMFRGAGISPEEQENAHFEKFLKNQGNVVSRDDVLAHVNDEMPRLYDNVSDSSTQRFKQYSTPGLNHYTEHVITSPSAQMYTHAHWPDHPSVLMHYREGQTQDVEGKNVTHLDEIQSDLHQAGRENGYAGPPTGKIEDSFTPEHRAQYEELRDRYMNFAAGGPPDNPDSLPWNEWAVSPAGRLRIAHEDERDAAAQGMRDLENRYAGMRNLHGDNMPPDAPFKKNWHEVAFKHALHTAAKNGSDRMTWTTGQTQTERYGLGNDVASLHLKPRNINDDKIIAGDVFHFDHRGFGSEPKYMSQEDAARQYGPGNADRLFNNPSKKLYENVWNGPNEPETPEVSEHYMRTEDLDPITHAGMAGFYDRILPQYAQKLAKVYRTGVGTTQLSDNPVHTDPDGNALPGSQVYNGPKVHYIDIHPEMRHKLLTEGFPLWGDTDAATRKGVLDELSNLRIRIVKSYSSPYPYSAITSDQSQSLREALKSGSRTLERPEGASFMYPDGSITSNKDQEDYEDDMMDDAPGFGNSHRSMAISAYDKANIPYYGEDYDAERNLIHHANVVRLNASRFNEPNSPELSTEIPVSATPRQISEVQRHANDVVSRGGRFMYDFVKPGEGVPVSSGNGSRTFLHDPEATRIRSDIIKAIIDPAEDPDYRMHVSFESAPARSSGFMPGLHDAPYGQRLDYHKEIHDAIFPEGKDTLSPQFGLPASHTIIGPGAYEEAGELTNNPSTQMVLNMRLNGTQNGVHEDDRSKIEALASTLGYLTHQESVGYHKPYSTLGNEGASNGVGFRLFRPTSQAEMESIYHHLGKSMGESGVPALIAAPDGFRALNFSDMPHGEFLKNLLDAVHATFPKNMKTKSWDFGHDGDLIFNNWKVAPHGEEYASRIDTAKRSDVFRRIADLYDPVLRKIDEKFSSRYGWGNAARGESRKGIDAGEDTGAGLGNSGDQLRQDDRRIRIVGRGYQGRGSEVSGAATGERQNDPTRLTHFDTFPKVRYRELSGTTYINKPAMDILWPLFGAKPNNRMAVTVSPDRSRQTVDTLHGMADMRGVAASDHFNLHHVADELSTSLAYNPTSGLVIVPLSNPKTMIGLARHEDVHAGQNQLLKDNYTYLTHPQIRDLRGMDGWQGAEDRLRAFGYNSPQMLKEIPAYIAQGAHRKILGLNDEQARLITERYVQHIIDNHGKDAAKRIFRHSNSIAKLAARGVIGKGLRIWKALYSHQPVDPDIAQKLRDALLNRPLTDGPYISQWMLPDGTLTPHRSGLDHNEQAIAAYNAAGHPVPSLPEMQIQHHAGVARVYAPRFQEGGDRPNFYIDFPQGATKQQISTAQRYGNEAEERNGNFAYSFMPVGGGHPISGGNNARSLLRDPEAARIRGDVKKGMIRIFKGPSIHQIDPTSYTQIVRPNLTQDAPYTLDEFRTIQPDVTHYAMNADGGYGGHGNESFLARTLGLPDPADPMNQGPSLDKNYPAGKMDLARVRLQNDPDRPKYGEAILGARHSKFTGGVAMEAALADPVLKSLRDQIGAPLIKTVPSKLTKPSDIAAVVKRGLDGKFWYKEWKNHIDGLYPPSEDHHLNRVAHILFGIGGANTSVEENLGVWSRLMSRYKAGLMGSEAQVRNLYDGTINNTSSKILKAGINGEPSARDIFNATQGIMPSSPKVNEYTAGSMGDYNSGPFDEWMSRALCGVDDSPTNGEYPRALKLARRAYIDYQKNPENPHFDNFAQFQASLWTGYKRVVVAHMLDTAEKITKHSDDPKHLKIAADIVNATRTMSGEGRPHELFVKYGLKNSDGSFNALPESPLYDIIAKHEGTLTDLKQSGAVVSDYVQKFPIDSGVQKVRDALKSSPLADTVHMERIKGVNYVVGTREQVRAALEHAIDQSTMYMHGKASAGPNAGHDIKFGIGKGGGWESRVSDTDALKSHFANTPEFLRDMQRAHVLLAGMAQAGKNDINAKYYGVKPENSDPFASRLADVSPWVEHVAKLADEERENAGQKRETIDAIRKALYESSRNKKIKITKSAKPYIRIQALRKDGQAGALQGRGWQGEICIIPSDTAITGQSRLSKAVAGIKAAPFTSNLHNVIDAKMPGVAPSEQVAGIVNSAGIAPEEIEHAKIGGFTEPGIKVSKQSLLDHIDANTPNLRFTNLGGDPAEQNAAPKWHSTYNGQKLYSAGLKKYKETLVHYDPYLGHKVNINGNIIPVGGYPSNFNSSHWQDHPNVLVHIRSGQSKDIEGNPVTHIDELQSDWHQAGRKKGYVDTSDAASYSRHLADNSGMPPDAPFKKTWHELGMKQALREAVENGSNRLTWSTGDVQNDRYKLSHHLDTIGHYEYMPEEETGEPRYYIGGFKNGSQVYSKVHTVSELPDIVGHDLATKIKNGEGVEVPWRGPGYRELRGKDLDIGGSGMRGFYDTMLPRYASKLVAKYGGTSGMTQRDIGAVASKTPIPEAPDVPGAETAAVLGKSRANLKYLPYNQFAQNKAGRSDLYTVLPGGWHVSSAQDETKDWNKYSRSWHRSHGPYIEVSNRHVVIKRKNPDTGEIEDRSVPVDNWMGKPIENAIRQSGILDTSDQLAKRKTENVHYMDISPKLRETIMNEGLPLWGDKNITRKGVITISHAEWPHIPLLSDPSVYMKPDAEISKALIRLWPDTISKTVQYNPQTGSWVTSTRSQQLPGSTWAGQRKLRIAAARQPESTSILHNQMARHGIVPIASNASAGPGDFGYTPDDDNDINGVVHHRVYSNLTNMKSLRRDLMAQSAIQDTGGVSNIHRLAANSPNFTPYAQGEQDYKPLDISHDNLENARRLPYLQGRYLMSFVGHDGFVHMIHSMTPPNDPEGRAMNQDVLHPDTDAALGRPPIVTLAEKPAVASPGLAAQQVPEVDRSDRFWRSSPDNIVSHPSQLAGVGPDDKWEDKWNLLFSGLSHSAARKQIEKPDAQQGLNKFSRIVQTGFNNDKKNTPVYGIFVPRHGNGEAVLGPHPAPAVDDAANEPPGGFTPAIDEPQPQPAPIATPGAVPREDDEDPFDDGEAPPPGPTGGVGRGRDIADALYGPGISKPPSRAYPKEPQEEDPYADWNNNPPAIGAPNTGADIQPDPTDSGPSMHPNYPPSNTDIWRRALAARRVQIGTDPLDPERYDIDGHAMNAPDYVGSEYLKHAMAHPQIRGLKDAQGNPLIVPAPSGLNNVRDLVNLIDDGLILRDSGDYDAKNWGQNVAKAYDEMIDPRADEATNRKIKILAGLGGNGLNFKDNIRGLTKMWSQWKSGLMRTPKQISQVYDSDSSQPSSRLTVGLGYRGDPTPTDKHLATLGIAPEHYRHNVQVAKFLGDQSAVPIEDWMTRLVTGKDIVPTQTEHERIDGILRSAFDAWNRTPKNRNTPLQHGQLADALWQGYNRLVGDHMEEMAKRIQYAHPDKTLPYFDDKGVLKAPPAKGDEIQGILNGLMRNQRTKLSKGIQAEPDKLMRELGLADETGTIRPPKLSPIHEFYRKWEPLLHNIHGTTGGGSPIAQNHGIATHHINKGADELDKMIRNAIVKDPELAGYMHVEPDGQGGKQFRGDSRMLRQLLRSNIRAGEAAFAKVDNDAVPETTKIHLSPGTDFESLPEIDRERLSEVFDKNPEFAQDAYTMHQTMKALAKAGRPDSELAKQYLEEGEKADRSEPLATQLADASKAMRLVFRHAYENKRGIDKPIVLKKGIGYGASIRISSITRGGNCQIQENGQAGRISERERPDYGSVGHEVRDGQGRQTGRIRIIKGLPDPEEEALAKKAHLREAPEGSDKCCASCRMFSDGRFVKRGGCSALHQVVGADDLCDLYEHDGGIKKSYGGKMSDSVATKMLPPPSPNREEFPFVGQMIVHGVHILIENKKGDVREGTDKNGHKWRNEMGAHYGEIANTVAKDGDAVDVYVLDHPDKATHVYIVHQNHVHGPKKGHDEDKLIVGACSEKEAKDFYNKQYDHPGFFGGIDEITVERFQEMFRDGKKFGKITKSIRIRLPVLA